MSTVGPHRDELELAIADMPARTHASQGEQRTLALALRLAAHRLVTERAGTAPVLVLDDVLSELDPRRSTKLLEHFPAGQVILTTAGVLPDAAHPDAVVRIEAGAVLGAVVGSTCAPADDDDRAGARARQPGGDRPRAARRPDGDHAPVASMGGVFGRWEEAVGVAVAAHVQPVRLDGTRLVVEVDDPAWATQLRFLEATMKSRLAEVAGARSDTDRRARPPP